MPSNTSRQIIVGVDFGTTYSGLAWTVAHRPERLATVTAWPDAADHEVVSEKVPTRLRYQGNDTQWGFKIPVNAPQHEILEWFKLDLDPTLPTIGQPTGEEITGGRTADVLVADYLAALRDHLACTLQTKFGPQIVSTASFSFVVTVPAIWSETAKDRITHAFRTVLSVPPWPQNPAIEIVSEPEAAAVSSLTSISKSHALRQDDTVVVVDAGGGTVDAISYAISKLFPLRLREAAPGCGAICGSAFLNMRFGKYVKLKFGQDPDFTDEVYAEAMDFFEKTAKRNLMINTPPSTTFPVPMRLRDNPHLGVSKGVYPLTVSELKTLFEPVVLETIKLVKEQVANTPGHVRVVLLVGGFAASTYLLERVRIAMGDQVDVIRPGDGWAAVVKGAVMRGLDASERENIPEEQAQKTKAPTNDTGPSPPPQTSPEDALGDTPQHEEEGDENMGNRSKVSYGVESEVAFDENLHGAVRERRYWSGREGRYKIRVMNWFIRRGDPLPTSPQTFTFSANLPYSVVRRPTLSTIIYLDANSAAPSLVRDAKARALCRVEANLGSLPRSALPQRMMGFDGKWYYNFAFGMEAMYKEAATSFSLTYKGKSSRTRPSSRSGRVAVKLTHCLGKKYQTATVNHQ
ncbi:hypothetical protein jhhlp_005623 [Lomentospora prolificans]|uniref:Actin-like ATPase domain-containing protein n=1 Tax=Lomentospora prolificans TaxID=41688 RepID=A0A2N3N3L2_9PEZI|nr:hypothetical protein jhhlp_005623 [Lomentospora prolificans]